MLCGRPATRGARLWTPGGLDIGKGCVGARRSVLETGSIGAVRWSSTGTSGRRAWQCGADLRPSGYRGTGGETASAPHPQPASRGGGNSEIFNPRCAESTLYLWMRCVFVGRGLNRSAVGKTAISTRGRPQPLASPTLTSLVACNSALRHAMLRHRGARWQLRSLPSLYGRLLSQPAPHTHIFNLLLKQTPCLSRLRPPRLHPQGRLSLS